jgi:hypothetical protein
MGLHSTPDSHSSSDLLVTDDERQLRPNSFVERVHGPHVSSDFWLISPDGCRMPLGLIPSTAKLNTAGRSPKGMVGSVRRS